MVSRIKLLSAHVANKIAAGEVVERPASVAKELIENAVDAGASQIDVEVAAGGRKLVAVRDNGCGMNRDDALLSIEQHATSKIRDVDDIERIATLGFRGEALAAIASVSRFRLETCSRDDDTGTELLLNGGKLQDVRDTGCPAGTSIEVRDLFFNVPARRKFLRSYQTEQAHLRACFMVQALAHPEIGMSLKIDGRQAYVLPGRRDEGDSPEKLREDRIRDLFGKECLQHLRKVEYAGGEVAVQGFVSLPAASRSDRNEIYTFVNGRATTAPLISFAIREGYHTLLPRDRHPSVFLFMRMDPELVDVNVHPTKREVRFRHPGDVRDALIDAVSRALGTPAGIASGSYGAATRPAPETATAHATRGAELTIEDLPPVRAFRYPRSLSLNSQFGRAPIPGAEPAAPFDPSRQPGATDVRTPGGTAPDPVAPAPASPWSWCRVLGQVGSLYVVMETEDGLVLMDPHAAHERVLFERFMADVIHGEVASQALLLPETAELSPKDALRVRQNVKLLKQMGFGISEFGGDAFVVDALPSYFAALTATRILVEVSHSLEESGARGGTERWREEAIAQAACKSAVKARDRLSLQEIEQLVVDLSRTEMPYTCPHGRPTLIFMGYRDLNKKFGRE